ETGSAVVRSLGTHGRMLVYGTLSEEPITLHPRVLMVGQKRIEGFWLSEWTKEQSKLTMLSLFRTVQQLLRTGVLTSEVGTTFAMDDVRKAAAQASQPGRQGKVLLRLG